jgi:hypothetical protein
MKRTAEAQELLDTLDAELAEVGEARGQQLSWTAAERELLSQLANTVDRRSHVRSLYEKVSGEPKVAVKVSVELRQLDKAVAGLLKQLHTDVPQQESVTTLKARRAANARWERERATG